MSDCLPIDRCRMRQCWAMVVTVACLAGRLEPQYDVIVAINDDTSNFDAELDPIVSALLAYEEINPKVADEVSVVPLPNHPSKRLVSQLTRFFGLYSFKQIFSPTGPLNTDVADCRNVYEAAERGMKRVTELGFKAPLMCVGKLRSACLGFEWMSRDWLELNAILGSYHALYTPLEVREMCPSKYPKVDRWAVIHVSQKLIDAATAIEEGRAVARDIGGSDPERMAAPNIVDYLQSVMTGLENVSIAVEEVDGRKYPLMAAVDRAASVVPRHRGRVVHLEYTAPSSDQVDTTLFLVGKGITYDTGGADVKAGGRMAGMHRDKCGAAAIAGLFKTLGILQPPGLRVVGSLAFVRNSIGAESYVADEIIVSRAAKRVRVCNTDAEGRMVMADLLCEAKEKALMDNGPARQAGVSRLLQAAGDRISDIAEISTVRREDFKLHRGKSEYEDILQSNTVPSTITPRGHQTPAAFLAMVSGLEDTYNFVYCDSNQAPIWEQKRPYVGGLIEFYFHQACRDPSMYRKT